VIGKNCIIGGASGIAGHLTIADGVHLTAMTMVIKSLTEPGVYSSGTGVQTNAKWRKSIARLRQLDKMADRIKQLEQTLKARDVE
jgi:UDP-3-O-[3-hydroxymyristoyl] glucosamine N-acyltransferase